MTARSAVLRDRLLQRLGWPDNLGIEVHQLQLGDRQRAEAHLIWVDGLVAARIIRETLAALAAYRDQPEPTIVARSLPIPNRGWVHDPIGLAGHLANGHAALLAEGWPAALLLDTSEHEPHPEARMVPPPEREAFVRDLRTNLALLRRRLRDPELRAVRVPLRRPGRGEVALVYLQGKAQPALVRLLRCWAGRHLGEEAAGRGIPNSAPAALGLLPRLDTTRWPDKAAVLLDAGHVVMLVDRMGHVHAAPVTAASWLSAPGDFGLPYPLIRLLVRARLLFYLAVLLLPGSLIALLNYHVDMVPTPFVAAAAAARENSAFGSYFEVFTLEILTEVAREAAFRLPAAVPLGAVLIATTLITLLGVQSGFVGPLPALGAVLGALFSLALPSYGGTYLVRVWRFYVLLGAVTFGFFGVAAVCTVLAAYLCTARRWGVPFLGPAGGHFTAPEGTAARPPGRGRLPGRKGGGRHGQTAARGR